MSIGLKFTIAFKVISKKAPNKKVKSLSSNHSLYRHNYHRLTCLQQHCSTQLISFQISKLSCW